MGCEGDTTVESTEAAAEQGIAEDARAEIGDEDIAESSTENDSENGEMGTGEGEEGSEFSEGNESGEEPGKDCPPLDGVRPAAIAEMAGAYTPEGVVFFGGDNGFPIQCSSNPSPQGETWIFDPACAHWTLVEDDGSAPGARTRATGVFDSTENRLLVFGGRYRAQGTEGDYEIYNEVWALDLSAWSWELLETTGSAPVPRWSSAGIYDPVRHQFVITGGNDGVSGLNYEPVADTYVLDLESLVWEARSHQGGPNARLFGATAYDAKRQSMILFGGTTDFFGPMLNDLWSYDLGEETWTQLSSGSGKAPERRFWPSITVESAGDRYILFGGHDDGVLGNRNDLWVYTRGADVWGRASAGDELNPAAPAPGFCDFPTNFVIYLENTPERRSMHLAVSDGNGHALILGGKTDCGIVDDVWELTLGDFSWELLMEPTVGVSCERYGIEGCDAFCF